VAVLKRRDEIDGINILLFLVFISAAMGEIGVVFLEKPLLMFGLTALTFAVFAALLVLTYLVFAVTGSKRALSFGLMTSQRNMGLMIAGTGGIVPDLTWLYFAVSQFPIYLSPLMIQPIARWFEKRELAATAGK
jgi:BASS family bile acid:Na+ symporter